jgi:heme/copper-type cytochrome/quinol oxidase subunit 2
MAARLLVLRSAGSLLCFLLALAFSASASGLRPGQDPARHDITITGRDYQFTPARIDVASGDILVITVVAEDRPYSFAIDAYRISKRATPGHPAKFEFRADRAGTFPFYCDLTTDDGYKGMRGNLAVEGR